MPQLKGKEYREVYDLLLDYLSPSGLDRVLQHNNLPSLVEIGGQGDFRTTVFHAVQELSKRYQIMELLEGALAELDGSCPPISAWLESNRAELLRRRDQPTSREKFRDSVDTHRWTWAGGAFAVALLLAPIVAVSIPGSTSEVAVNDVRFIEFERRREPGGTEYDFPVVKLDTQVINRGSRTATLSKARLHVDEIIHVKPWILSAAEPLLPSAEYFFEIPVDRDPPFHLDVPISHSLKPDEPDRFTFLLLGGSSDSDTIVKARLEIFYDEDEKSVQSPPVAFVLEPLFTTELPPLTPETLFRSDWMAMDPRLALEVMKGNKAVLPQLRELSHLDTTNRFRMILNKIESSSDIDTLEAAIQANDQAYQRLRRAFFIEAYSSLIHPSLVPAVFGELSAFMPQLQPNLKQRLIDDYAEYKTLKLSWLEGVVLPSLRSMRPVDGVAQKQFTLPDTVRLSPEDDILMERNQTQHEWEFIIGKLQGIELEEVIVKTFVEETIMPMLRRFHNDQPMSLQDEAQTKQFVQRAVFEELGLFGNSDTCLNQALVDAGANFSWVEKVREPVVADFDQLVRARIDWINRALYKLEAADAMVSIPVPDMLKLNMAELDDLNQIDVSPSDRMSLKRELELLTTTMPNGSSGRASTPEGPGGVGVTPFVKVIVRFAAQNIRNQYNQSLLMFPNETP